MHSLPWWNWALQVIGLLASYVGAEMNARMRVEGFYVWLLANVTLFAVHVSAGLWALALLDLLYLRINLTGIRRWRRAGPPLEVAQRAPSLDGSVPP